MATRTETIGVRITKQSRKLIRKYLERDQHINESDFIRDAIREKIERDAPDLVNELFEGEAEK